MFTVWSILQSLHILRGKLRLEVRVLPIALLAPPPPSWPQTHGERGERGEQNTIKLLSALLLQSRGILTVSAHIEDGGPADEAVWIVELVLLVGCVVFGPHLIRDGPGNGVHQVTIEAAVSTNVHRSWPSPALASKKKDRT